MTSLLARPITPDMVVTLQIRPEMFRQFVDARGEGGPLLKGYRGSVTLVSPGKSHESMAGRLANLILAVGLELGIRHAALRSTTWALPEGGEGTAYEPDESYYVQSLGTAGEDQVPDLAVEVVVTNPERKALLAGAALGIPELWVMDIPGHRLTFYHLATRGKQKGTYRPKPASRAFPLLRSAEVLERLDDPEPDDAAFHENCRAWGRNVLVRRAR
jgi:Uma2 family endonuclease